MLWLRVKDKNKSTMKYLYIYQEKYFYIYLKT